MASELLAMLSQHAPSLQTREGLIITGLQNDFLEGGKLPITVPPGYFDRLQAFVSAFREIGDVIWVRSEFQAEREVNNGDDRDDTVILGPVSAPTFVEEDIHEDERESPVPPKRPRTSFEATDRILAVDEEDLTVELPSKAVDEELYLKQTASREACCIPGSSGAEFAPQVQALIDPDKDLVVTSTHYSAFGSTSLLFTLRSKLVTELFICGGPTNLSVYATAMDCARYGLPITLVDDCLLARSQERHDIAVKHLREVMEADIMTSDEVIQTLTDPPSANFEDDEEGLREIEYRGLEYENNSQDSDRNLEIDLEVDEDQSMLDTFSSRPTSARLYDHLQELGFRSPDAHHSLRTATNQVNPSFDTGLLEAVPNEEMVSAYPRVSQFDGQAADRKIENPMEEPKPAGVSLDNLGHDSESSSTAMIENWLERSKMSTKPSAHSTHPGLNAIASLCHFDQKLVNEIETNTYEELRARESASMQDKKQWDENPLLGEGKEVESAGSCILYDLLPSELAETIFDKLESEVVWQRMHHREGEVPRLVCCQGSIGEDGSMPVYRHPSDQTLPTESWTSTVDEIRKAAEQAVGHQLNHALIQLYRGGRDYISEHSDKTLDIVKDSYIVNVSFGAQRTMRLRTKRAARLNADEASPARTTYRIPMPHNSMIKMSLATNAEYLHGINADRRLSFELNEAEKAFEGRRISLTFRNIGTFLNHDSTRIWGQGARGKCQNEQGVVVNADAVESERLVKAFGAENQASSIQWDEIYGNGFDVLHLT